MRLIFLTSLVMIAFSANSLLNRAALLDGGIGPASYAWVRLVAGAMMLALLLLIRDRSLALPRPNALMLIFFVIYMLGSSFGFNGLEAGIGSLILFSTIQITMFLFAQAQGKGATRMQWIGLGISIIGLTILVWPTQSVSLPLLSVAFMVASAIGWGLYSALGASARDPLRVTAWNFIYTIPLMTLACAPFSVSEPIGGMGLLYAILSGAIASGMGYAIWYRVLPDLGAVKGALVQRIVPVMNFTGGVLLFSEIVTPKAAFACVLILGGMGLGKSKT